MRRITSRLGRVILSLALAASAVVSGALASDATIWPGGLDGPTISIPSDMPGAPGDFVEVPVSFYPADSEITTIVFSIDFDRTLLHLDPTDSDGDGTPDAIKFEVPPVFATGASYDGDDDDGEIDCFIADMFPPLAAVPDGTLMTIRLQVLETAGGSSAHVGFSNDPAPSFGDSGGQSVAGYSVDGSIAVESLDWLIYLPSAETADATD